MNIINRTYILVILILGCVIDVAGQIKVSCVFDIDTAYYAVGQIDVLDSKSEIVAQRRVDSTAIAVMIPDEGAYMFNFTAFGYNDWSEKLYVTNDTTINICPQLNPQQLNEVVVEGTMRPQTTATGKKYKLSDMAKQSGNPFLALTEIPDLDVNVAEQTIKLQDGLVPLILIDGKYINSGIYPIDPKFIESVEIIEVMNAKYLQMGVSRIIDIRLKRKMPFYSYTEVRARNDVPLREGFGGVRFEFGSSRLALSGNIFVDYIKNDRTRFTSYEIFGHASKYKDGASLSNKLGWDGELMIKWIPSDNDYLTIAIKSMNSHERGNSDAKGEYETESLLPLSITQRDKIISGGTLATAFYEHTFGNKSTISAYTHYNRGYYDEKYESAEKISGEENLYAEFQKSVRDQCLFVMDFDCSDSPIGSISGGNEFKWTTDRNYNWLTEPHDFISLLQATNYTYLAYSNRWSHWLAMASAGMQYMKISTGGNNASWWRPRLSAAITYAFQKSQSIRISYSLDNKLPASSAMATFNTSTDPWVRKEGNPYLTPEKKHDINLTYDKAFTNLNLRGYGSFIIVRDMITPSIKNQSDISVHTFENNGVYQAFRFRPLATLRIGRMRTTAYSEMVGECYDRGRYHHSVSLGGNLMYTFGNMFVYARIAWRNKDYTPTSVTRYANPIEAHAQLTWQPTKSLQLTLGLPYFWGVRKEKVTTTAGAYYKCVETRHTGTSLRPWILISWSMRRNTQIAIDDRMPNY